MLKARGLTPSPQQRARLEAKATDIDASYDEWIGRAVRAQTVEDLF